MFMFFGHQIFSAYTIHSGLMKTFLKKELPNLKVYKFFEEIVGPVFIINNYKERILQLV
jgi:hypothetical protein